MGLTYIAADFHPAADTRPSNQSTKALLEHKSKREKVRSQNHIAKGTSVLHNPELLLRCSAHPHCQDEVGHLAVVVSIMVLASVPVANH